MRLIDATALIKQFDGFGFGSECDGEIVLEAVVNAPTVEAVEVVRCKACKHHTGTASKNAVYCISLCRFMKVDDFCSYGERKDND